MLFKVPGAKSSLGLPGTVTRPALVGCLNWRWLPRVVTRNQPSLSSIRSTSLTFMREEYFPTAMWSKTLKIPLLNVSDQPPVFSVGCTGRLCGI